MFRSKKDIGSFAASCLLLFVLVAGILWTDSAAANINDKVAQLDVNNSTLGDVVRIFGEPEKYLWGNETFTKNNLPGVYIARYPNDFSIVMSSDHISELRFESPAAGYIFRGKIQVGSTLDDVLALVGQPKETVEGKPLPQIAQEGTLYKEIGGQKGYCYYKPADQNVRFFFSNNRISALYLTCSDFGSGGSGSFQTVRPIEIVKEYDDVRWKDMSKLNLTGRKGLVASLTFNQKTVWPPPNKLPGDRKPQIVLKKAMNPGLGIRNLHQQDITGKGFNVAIIDQAMYLDHPEFSGKIVAYHDLAAGEKSSMHGPAVTSLLAGTNCGTAPDARVYYAAVRSGVYEVDYVDGLDWIIEKNRTLPATEKIRVVSVSAAPGKAGTTSTDNQKKWDEACARAEAAGILVLDCTSHHGFIGPCWYDDDEPENVAKCTPGFPGLDPGSNPGHILVPASPRTTAEEYDKGKFGYQYCGRGGLSWAIPYCAGILAMGWQINPEISLEQMRQLLFQSAYTTKSGDKIINPKEFINLVKKTKVSSETGKSE
jgi:serine protease AprX